MSFKLIAILFALAFVIISVCIFLQRAYGLFIDVLFRNMTMEVAARTMKEDIRRVLSIFARPFVFISKAFRGSK